MFFKLCLFVVLVGCFYALKKEDSEKPGPYQALLNSRLMTCDHDRNLKLDVSQIKIYFYDFSNNFSISFPIEEAAKKILKIENLDKRRKFVMFIGGYTSYIDHSVEKQIREAYKTYPDSYIIIPDHSAYTDNDNVFGVKNYKRAVFHAYYIGEALGLMWAKLKSGGVSPKNIHYVGHSLGGQIVGYVGSTFFNETGEKISRVTALDPAGPCFVNTAVGDQVRSGVAEYVEIYHSNAGALGSSSVLGDADFFMNKNGESNPSCPPPLLPGLIKSSKAASCNHRVCVDMWTASMKHPYMFWAYSCESYEMFKEGKCLQNLKVNAGFGNPGIATGKFYFSTEDMDLNALA